MMPESAEILDGLSLIANRWQVSAVAWHFLIGALVLGFGVGWRPSNRLVVLLLAALSASVSTIAWISGNPFNGTAFSALSLMLAAIATRPSLARGVQISSSSLFVPGALLTAFGWVYPHFLTTGSWTSYLYAAPLGLLPCPSLSVILGVSLMLNVLGSRLLGVALMLAGIAYGLIGAFRLGVTIDLFLVAGAGLTGLVTVRQRAPPGGMALESLGAATRMAVPIGFVRSRKNL